MKDSLVAKTNLIVSNRLSAMDYFEAQKAYNNPVIGYIYASKEKPIDCDRIAKAAQLIVESEGGISVYGGYDLLISATMLSMAKDMPETLAETQKVYEKIVEEFGESAYFPILAFYVQQYISTPLQYGIIKRASDIYRGVREEQKLVVSTIGVGYSLFLAMTNRPVETIIREIVEIYRIVKSELPLFTSLMSLSFALCFTEDDPEDKCADAIEIYNRLSDEDVDYGTNEEIAALGLLAVASKTAEGAIEETLQVDKALRETKGFQNLSLGKARRAMYASLLVAEDNLGYGRNEPFFNPARTSNMEDLILQLASIYTAVACGIEDKGKE